LVAEWSILVDENITSSLLHSLNQGPIVNERGQRLLTEAQVARFDGLRVDIFANEHPPPHFRISCAGVTANYRISDGTKLNGALDKYERNVRAWYSQHRDLLIQCWNDRRPSDCPVGEFRG